MKQFICFFIVPLISYLLLGCEKPSPDESTSGYSPTAVPLTEIKTEEIASIWYRKTHPRVLLDKEQLELVLNRMYGPNKREPYYRWFKLIKDSEDNGKPVDLVNLALIYKATQNKIYKDKFVQRIQNKGVPSLSELYAIDIMFDELNVDIKLKIMQRVAEHKNPWYSGSIKQSKGKSNVSWGYHDAIRVAPAFAYSAIFADTILEKNKNEADFPFDAKNFLNIVDKQLSKSGYFLNIENRIAGDKTYNNALVGDSGGMYDNFGYDASEESFSLYLLLQHYNLTGEKRFEQALHDKYRAHFYQNMGYPHKVTEYKNNQWCRKAQTKSHLMAYIWNPQYTYTKQPSHNTVLANTFLFKDPKMQYYANTGLQRELCGPPYNGMFWDLIYYDETLKESPLHKNKTATYFNGPGLVSMRSDWSDKASFAVLMAGEGISRRYEDANSFILSRKVDIITNAGARIRFNADNKKHFWYSIRSASKNTLKIMDPDESFDIKEDGTTGLLHSGTPLVDSDNLGGQITELSPSNIDGCYNTYQACNSNEKRSGKAFPLGIYETANITKYEHIPDKYTYSVGDATAAYTKKIDYFEREFLYLRPDIFIIFDRVKSVNPQFKKIWTIHTIDEPVVDKLPSLQSMGMKSFINKDSITISNPKNVTFIDTLLPRNNKIVIRGGDTIIASEKSAEAIKPVTLDIPRWVEIFITGENAKGQLTITGETKDNSHDTEVISFDGRVQNFYSGKANMVKEKKLLDEEASWNIDQWTGYQVTLKVDNKIRSFPIEGNIENTLFGHFPTLAGRTYTINKAIANSYKHWKQIKSVRNNNIQMNNITISVPHYFDTTDASGRLHSFSPHTDFIDDNYHNRKELGRWTLEIEATKPMLLDNFLNILSLKDPGSPKPKTTLLESTNVYGAMINNTLVVFAKEPSDLSEFTLEGIANIENGLIANLKANSKYYLKFIKKDTYWTLHITLTKNEGQQIQSSAMGLLEFQTNTLEGNR